MKTAILQAPICKMEKLTNLFIEMTAKSCNQRCKYCYIDFPITRKIKDFIPTDMVEKALEDTRSAKPECIYLTGAEPMTHPDFNIILRMCLKYSNVCICTNGSFINEKKARFLRKVQDEGNNEIIFKLSLDHYNELKNDEVRCRGSFRQVLNAIKHLSKYEFNPIITVTNFYNEDKNTLCTNIKQLLSEIGFEAEDRNICINEYFDKTKLQMPSEISEEINSPDCKNGRILTVKGIYSCPFLANDHRGRSGSSFLDYSKKTSLETEYCNICLNNKRQMFGINFVNFNY